MENENSNTTASENWARPSTFDVEEIEEGLIVFRPQGFLEYDSSYRFRNILEKYVAQGFNKIVVNIAELEFIDSLGTGVLITGFGKCAERGGKLVLAAPNEKMEYVIKIMHLHNVFEIYDTEEKAITSIK